MSNEKEKPITPINVFNYILANFRRHKLRYGLTIFGLTVCTIFFILIASLSIGLYEPTEPETPTEEITPVDQPIDPAVLELDQNVKQTIVNWLYLTSVLIFITATAGVANTMLISMLERKREIGILKSVGLNRKEILQIFFAESFSMCSIAMVVGVLLGIHLSNNVFNYIEYGQYIFFGTMRTPPVVIGAAFIIVFVVGVLAALVPAFRAAKLTPIEALRG
jgi:hypothetical protein